MDEHVRAALLASFRHVYRPLVRLALHNGISFTEYTESIKPVFIESAREDFGTPDRNMTSNGVAIMTGLELPDVRRYDEGGPGAFGRDIIRVGLIAALIEAWTSDGDFTGPYGIPLELEPKQTTPNGFGLLVKRYGEGFPERAIIAEMRRVGAIEITKRGKLRLISRTFIAGRFRPESMDRMGKTLRDLAETLVHNLDPKDGAAPRFERHVYTPDGIDEETMAEFREFLKEDGQKFLESVDNWFSEKEQEDDRKVEQRLLDPEVREAKRVVKVGVGMYSYEHRIEKRPGHGETEDGNKEAEN
ncbi:MAG: DUF6502 family protein [Gammaproteobacteria bacterium]